MIPTIEILPIKHYGLNTAGRDFAVGDIHGHFFQLQLALDAAGFKPAVDRLFSVGDLVDRGPDSRDVLEWLAKPWFHAVRGNHDDYVARAETVDIGNWLNNGGMWFAGMPWDQQQEYIAVFRELPIAIEVETAGGLIGIVHADCTLPSWEDLRRALEAPESHKRLKLVHNTCMWSRSRIENSETHGVEGVRALVVGHDPRRHPVVLGNVYHIDTRGWRPNHGGYFTLLNLATLETIPPMPANLDWEEE